MTYSVIYTTTKPENAGWFNDVNENTVDSINSWLPTNVGFISAVKNSELSNSTTIVKTYTFDTEANYKAWLQAKNNNSAVITRRNHNDANGIVTTIQVV